MENTIMKIKFLIFNLQDDRNSNGMYFYPVMVKGDTDTYLQFDSYDNAEKWIAEQREIEDKNIYQIQKLYLPK